MNTYTALLDDGLVTQDEIDLALSDHTTAPFPGDPGDNHDYLDAGLTTRSLIAFRPRSIHDGLANLARMRRLHIPIGGVGLCLYDVRENCWGIDALWPTAKDAGLHGAPVHRYKHFDDAPRGMSLIFVNDHVWHIAVALGAGLNNTSDLHENGYNGIATIERTYEWCGAHDWFGIETVNNVDCWPDPAKAPWVPKPFTLEEKLAIIRAKIAENKRDHHPHRVARLQLWAEELMRRIEERDASRH